MKWKYYQHALIPDGPPHISPKDSLSFHSIVGEYKSIGGISRPLFARYCTDFDCGFETPWWYVIKDSPLDISTLSSKRRYEITKGLKRVDIRQICPAEYAEQMYFVHSSAMKTYPKQNQVILNKELYCKTLRELENKKYVVFGAFLKDNVDVVNSNTICGFLVCIIGEGVIYFSQQKALPEYERHGVNTSLIYHFIDFFSKELSTGWYILDGERAVRHITVFQDYLEKYFGFRKAYAILHFKASLALMIIILLIKPFSKQLKQSERKFLFDIGCVVEMKKISNSCEQLYKKLNRINNESLGCK